MHWVPQGSSRVWQQVPGLGWFGVSMGLSFLQSLVLGVREEKSGSGSLQLPQAARPLLLELQVFPGKQDTATQPSRGHHTSPGMAAGRNT